MMTATQIMLLRLAIRFDNISDVLQAIGIQWELIGFNKENELEAVRESDDLFFSKFQSFFSNNYLEQEDSNKVTSMIQRYLIEHPIRKTLLKIAVDRKMFSIEILNNMKVELNMDKLRAVLDEQGNRRYVDEGLEEKRRVFDFMFGNLVPETSQFMTNTVTAPFVKSENGGVYFFDACSRKWKDSELKMDEDSLFNFLNEKGDFKRIIKSREWNFKVN